ncbi:ArsR/SmtB family transcription factor [Amycolatopsis anabasis]|uniref:ArsR/SmtB family transcription factor n=1 Tax=Amycolatopsis anabasis TaxID=1840409 RepID=UPI00131CC786|nr:winged helix-turn-helix domain-containing protein [Amycolatopsis anabasis]
MDANLAFDALADEVRREILSVLSQHGECSAGEIARNIDRVGRTTVSSHLRVLRTSGVVVERKEGRNRFYALNSAGPARDALEFLQDLFQSSLKDLKSTAEAGVRSESGESGRRAG